MKLSKQLGVLCSTLILISSILIGCGGTTLEFNFDETEMTIHATMWSDQIVAYSDIQSAELKQDLTIGKRTNGYGDGKMVLGEFQNDEYGKYTLYGYTDSEEYVALRLKDGSIFVIGGKNKIESQDLYQTIRSYLK